MGCFLKNKSLEFSGPDDCFLHMAANQLPEIHSSRYATLPRGVSVHVPSPFPERSLPHPNLLAPHIRSQPGTAPLRLMQRLSFPSSNQPGCTTQAGDPRTLFSLVFTSNKIADLPPSFYEGSPCSCDCNSCWVVVFFLHMSQDYGPITQLVSFGGGPSASPARVLIWGSPEAPHL